MGARHTLVHQLADWADRKPNETALRGRDAEGKWQPITWAEYWRRVRALAKGLALLGHRPGEPLAIVGANRPEWVISQFGVMAAGGMAAPIYPTSTPDQVTHILGNCEARIVVVDNQKQLQRFQALRADGKIRVDKILTMDPVGDMGPDVLSFSSLIDRGQNEGDDAEVEQRMAGISLDETGLFIYTSGTTGVPKGAQLSHRGLAMVGPSVEHDYPEIDHHPFRVVSYLPLSHIAEQVFTNFLQLTRGGEVYFCEDLKKVQAALVDARPTVFIGVPRVWEKFEAAMRARLAEATGLRARLAAWARQTELTAFEESSRSGRQVGGLARRIAHRLVVSRVKEALGLEDLVIASSGAAPIASETLEFFASIGIPIHEAYGMTETTGVIAGSPYMRPKFGTVGRPIHGVQVRIAADGEIQVRGDNVARGYHRMPEESAEMFSPDGWLCTGDLGEIDADGYLKITGRKKDLLITAGGKNVAPSEMETHITTIPGIGQAVVVGDRKPYLSALLALDPDAMGALCREAGVAEAPLAKLADDPKLVAHIQHRIDEVCNSKVARYQTIKKIRILPKPFTVETGELTPSMKVRRKVVGEMYADAIEELYR